MADKQLAPARSCGEIPSAQAPARVVKWQTRTFEGRMPQGMGVQVPPRALWDRRFQEEYTSGRHFRDERDPHPHPHPRSRLVFASIVPVTLAKWLEQPDTLRRRLAQMQFAFPYNGDGVRVCRVEAIMTSPLNPSFCLLTSRARAFPYCLIKHAAQSSHDFTS